MEGGEMRENIKKERNQKKKREKGKRKRKKKGEKTMLSTEKKFDTGN